MAIIHSLIWSDDQAAIAELLQSEVCKAVPGVDKDVVADLARQSAGDLIKGISNEKKAVIRRLTERAVRNDWSADTLADRIKAQVGLDERGSNAVENFRQGLLDKGVPRGTARTEANLYAKRLRTARASTIANTELLRLTSVAKRAQWEVWKSAGVIDQYAVRVWHVHKDERRCPLCRSLNGQRAAVGGKYRDGHVGPPLHPNCRCHETLERGPVLLAKEEVQKDRVRTPEGMKRFKLPIGAQIGSGNWRDSQWGGSHGGSFELTNQTAKAMGLVPLHVGDYTPSPKALRLLSDIHNEKKQRTVYHGTSGTHFNNMHPDETVSLPAIATSPDSFLAEMYGTGGWEPADNRVIVEIRNARAPLYHGEERITAGRYKVVSNDVTVDDRFTGHIHRTKGTGRPRNDPWNPADYEFVPMPIRRVVLEQTHTFNPDTGEFEPVDEWVQKDRVRTLAGVKRFKLPIGAVIPKSPIIGEMKPEYHIDNASAKVSPTGYVYNLKSTEKGQGSKLMGVITRDADRKGITLSAHARPDLHGWYGQFGFSLSHEDDIGPVLIRPLGGVPAPSRYRKHKSVFYTGSTKEFTAAEFMKELHNASEQDMGMPVTSAAFWLKPDGKITIVRNHAEVPGGYDRAFGDGWVRVNFQGGAKMMSVERQHKMTEEQVITMRTIFMQGGIDRLNQQWYPESAPDVPIYVSLTTRSASEITELLRKSPHDGDGDGFYALGPGAKDITPMPRKLKLITPEAFARMYPPGEHDIPVEHLYAIRDVEAVDDPRRHVDLSGGQKESVEVWVLGGYASLADGHHRLYSAIKQGKKTLRTTVHTTSKAGGEPILSNDFKYRDRLG